VAEPQSEPAGAERQPGQTVAERPRQAALAADAKPGRPLRVGLNLIFLGERAGGAGRYARELPGALLAAEPATEITVFVSREEPADLREQPWAGAVRWVKVPVRMQGPPLHVPAEYLLLPALARALRLDVLHSPANTGPAIAPGVASVVSVLDLIWLHRPEEWEASARVHRTMRRRVQRASKNADRIFAISHAAAEDLRMTLGVARERIDVTPLGVRLPASAVTPSGVAATATDGSASIAAKTPEAVLREQLDLGSARVLLCVAQKRPYKNLHRLVRALPVLDEDVVLVLPGAPTPYEAQLRSLAQELGVAARTRFPNWLSEEQLESLYALSSAFVLPSLIEGFGLPVLEAMLRGVPVACSSTSALGEIAGDAALTFDPERQAEIDAALARLLADRAYAHALAQRGREHARTFTWKRTGELSLAGYRRALAR
jgi:glycosyltransferase involved in cell wall biosynthesis